jgi:hypothetical protein
VQVRSADNAVFIPRCCSVREETLADSTALWGTAISGLLADPDELVTAALINHFARTAHVVGRVRPLAQAPGGSDCTVLVPLHRRGYPAANMEHFFVVLHLGTLETLTARQ